MSYLAQETTKDNRVFDMLLKADFPSPNPSKNIHFIYLLVCGSWFSWLLFFEICFWFPFCSHFALQKKILTETAVVVAVVSGSKKFRGELNWKFKIELILIFLNSRLKSVFNWTYSLRKIIETELHSLGRPFFRPFVHSSKPCGWVPKW